MEVLADVSQPELALADVLARTGLGRNTFYGHFANVGALALYVAEGCTERVLAAIGQEVQEALTPHDAAMAFSTGLFGAVAQRAVDARVALNLSDARLREAIALGIQRVVDRGVRAGAFRGKIEDERVAALLGASLELCRICATEPGRASSCARVLSEVLVRTLR